MDKKKELYKQIKIIGIIFSIPMTLAAGPISGYYLGDFLEKKFSLSFYFPLIFAGIGFIGSIIEIIRIIKLAIKIDKD